MIEPKGLLINKKVSIQKQKKKIAERKPQPRIEIEEYLDQLKLEKVEKSKLSPNKSDRYVTLEQPNSHKIQMT